MKSTCEFAVEFLELVKKFKEYGFKENNILDCLQTANNDGDKALECSVNAEHLT